MVHGGEKRDTEVKTVHEGGGKACWELSDHGQFERHLITAHMPSVTAAIITANETVKKAFSMPLPGSAADRFPLGLDPQRPHCLPPR